MINLFSLKRSFNKKLNHQIKIQVKKKMNSINNIFNLFHFICYLVLIN